MKIMVLSHLDNNIGDDIMIKLLVNYFAEHQFFLYSDRSIIRRTFTDCKNVIFRNVKDRILDISTIDAFVCIGGSIFSDLNDIKGQARRLLKIAFIIMLKIRKKNVVTIGCNLGPYYNKIGPLLTKWELSLNDLVTVRDADSYNTLDSFKCIKDFYYIDDIVYNLEYDNNQSTKTTGLGISVYRSSKLGEINFANYEALAQITDTYIDLTEKPVRLFAFDIEYENDLVAAHHVLNLSRRKDKIEIIPYLGEHSLLIDKMNECERFICIRFHSAVLSDKLCIPFLPIIYSNKMESFLEDYGYRGKLFYLGDLKIDNLDINEIVRIIIDGSQIFNQFNKSSSNSLLHFEKLSELLDARI